MPETSGTSKQNVLKKVINILNQCVYGHGFGDCVQIDCKTVVFFANASNAYSNEKQRGKYSDERSGASVETARENGERQ